MRLLNGVPRCGRGAGPERRKSGKGGAGGFEDAINVCALFNIYDRLADALGWYLPDAAGYAASAQNLMKRGYLL